MSEILVLNGDNYGEVTGSGAVVVDFYADWCGPCKRMEPIFHAAKDDYEGKIVFAKVNVDDNKPIALENKIMLIPTLFFYKDGQLMDRVSDVIDKGALYAKLDALL